ncbi:MAG: lanthionine synthetase C family protein [Egibacteraceae bacterium]
MAVQTRRPSSAAWGTLLDPQRRDAAVAVARDVAVRAGDPGRVSAALAVARGQTRFPQSLRWEPYSIAAGEAGLAVMCAYLDACLPGAGWDVAGHGFLATAARGAERTPQLPPALFGGLSGLAFTASLLSRGGTRYQRFLASLDDTLAPQASALGARLRSGREPGGVSAFDVISGASGVGAYLLRRDTHGVLPEMLSGLVALAEPVEGPPRWHTPPHLLADESMARLYPWGNLNCGLAHGIPGPLALLALALRNGVEVPGQAEAIHRLAHWLLAHRADDEWGVNWPSAVPLPAPSSGWGPRRVHSVEALLPSSGGGPDASTASRPSSPAPAAGPAAPGPSRGAWCYGSPGIARALWLAGDALDDDEPRELAVEAVHAVLRRPVAVRQIESPTFCHGVAGLLQIVLRFAHDTGVAAFREAAAELVDQLLAAYEPERLLGYASLEPGANPVDRAGLLDGAPGVAMVLLAAATGAEPTWDRLFLLS